MNYKTELRDSKDGRTTHGVAFRLGGNGETWLLIGYTKRFKVYPRMVRARIAANNLCRRYHKEHCNELPFTLHQH